MNNHPWLPYLVTEYIEHLRPASVFEWGSGGSTLFFVELGVGDIVSIEHDEKWYSDIFTKLYNLDADINYRLIPPDPGEIGPDKADPFHYKSGNSCAAQGCFRGLSRLVAVGRLVLSAVQFLATYSTIFLKR